VDGLIGGSAVSENHQHADRGEFPISAKTAKTLKSEMLLRKMSFYNAEAAVGRISVRSL